MLKKLLVLTQNGPPNVILCPNFWRVTGHIQVRRMVKFGGVVTGHTPRRIDHLTTVVCLSVCQTLMHAYSCVPQSNEVPTGLSCQVSLCLCIFYLLLRR
jgi:acyl-[acyl carrier protein]--UDP-N-acetylglucosamine O-acyltransferase